jgi:hypothetical protein
VAIKEVQPKVDELEQDYLLDISETLPKKKQQQINKIGKKAITEIKDPLRYRISDKAKKIGAVSLLGLVVFANTDRELGYLMWNGSETKAHTLTEYEGKTADNSWVIIPGLGVQSGQGIASVESATLGHTGNVDYLDFSDDGVDPQDAALEITQLLDKQHAKTISFYNHSMGGVLMSKILQYLPDRFKLKFIVFDCSPSSIYDAKNSFSPTASKPADIYGGGFLSKLGLELWNNTISHKNNDLTFFQQVKDAWRVSVTGSSPRLFTNELGQLGSIDISESAARIKSAQAIYYAMPENPDADETVFTREALTGWESRTGTNIVTIIVKNVGHAEDTDKPNEYASALFPFLVLPYQESNQIEDKRRN